MDGIQIEVMDKVAVVTLDRPPANALTSAQCAELGRIFNDLGKDRNVNCAVLKASGSRSFCAGRDLGEFVSMTVEDEPQQSLILRELFAAVHNCEVPVIAAIHGPALGLGCVLAAACDIRVASTSASFGLPEVNVGRCGGGAHLGRLIPQGSLRRMFFSAEAITAEEAYRIGLVDMLVMPDALTEATMRLATTIAGKSPLGLRLGKKALNEAEYLPVADGYQREQSYSAALMRTADAREAARAVVEKRKPVFRGE